MKLLDSKGILLYASYAKHDTFFTLKAQPPKSLQKSDFSFSPKCLSNIFIIRKRTFRRVKRKSIWIEQIPRKSPFSFGAVRKNAALHPIRKMKRPISHLLALSPFYDASLFSSHPYIWLWNYYGCWAFFFRQNPSVFMVTHAEEEEELDIKLYIF